MLQPYDLRIEYKKNPLGMDESSPRFSYKLSGNSKEQKAYRIVVICECGKTVWDSGFVNSGESIQILYKGESFRQYTRYDWKVKVIDEKGVESAWSKEKAFFETGFLGTKWDAKWITGIRGKENLRSVQRFIKPFEIKGNVKKARLYITALGLYEAYINGKKISENCFTPGWTDYYDRVQYQAYDVKPFLKKGENVLASLLGDGWYSGVIARHWNSGIPTYGDVALLKAILKITLENGEEIVIPTDTEWKTFSMLNPIKMSDIYMGETYNAMDDDVNWKLPEKYKNCRALRPAVTLEKDVEIVWQSGANIRRMTELKPVAVTKRAPGTYIVDFGQNFTGRERFTLKNTTAGVTIIIKHAEMLNPDGSLYTENLREAAATTIYTCGGRKTETYESVFTFYGFRYLQISGWPGELTPDMISGQVIYSELEKTASFSCSNSMLNKLYSNIVWGQKSNFLDVPTDCPQRDERLGWTGDTQVFANIATFNMYSPEFYTKWIEDLNLSLMGGSECFAHFVPYPYKISKGNPATGWSDAGIICPWVMFDKYGDTRLIEKSFENILHYLDWQVKNANNSYIVANACYGDWLNIDDPTPENYLSTAYLAGMTKLVAKMARLIGKNDEAEKREKMALEIADAFRKEFFSESGEIKVKSQTAALLALHFELISGKAYDKTCRSLVKNIKETRKLHLSTGFLGTPLLMSVLTKIGQIDLAYDLLQQTTYPGWLYPVTQGATTMWERWNSYSHEHGFGDVGMNSFNHYAYGAVGEWFFETICGINTDTDGLDGRAYKRFRLAPQIGNSLTEASAEYETLYGKIASKWKRSGKQVEWSFNVPCNTVAEIVLPVSDKTFAKIKGIKCSNGKVIAEPGEYSIKFTV